MVQHKANCAICKKPLTEQDEKISIGLPGRVVATCCSENCFAVLCDLVPELAAERRGDKALGVE